MGFQPQRACVQHLREHAVPRQYGNREPLFSQVLGCDGSKLQVYERLYILVI